MERQPWPKEGRESGQEDWCGSHVSKPSISADKATQSSWPGLDSHPEILSPDTSESYERNSELVENEKEKATGHNVFMECLVNAREQIQRAEGVLVKQRGSSGQAREEDEQKVSQMMKTLGGDTAHLVQECLAREQ